MNKLDYGGNLHVLRDRQNFPDACVDLIYLDPPFNSKRDYEVFRCEPKEKRAFEDRHESTPSVHRRYVRQAGCCDRRKPIAFSCEVRSSITS